jgi:hypothetical protein
LSESPSGAATPWTYTTAVEPAPTTSHTPPTDPKELPLPPPVLQPLRKHETTGRAPPPRRRPDPPPQGLGWLVVLPGLIVTLLSAGLATSLFLYLAVRRDGDAPSFVPHGFYVAEMTAGGEVSPLFGLLGSTIIVRLLPLSVWKCAADDAAVRVDEHRLAARLPRPHQHGSILHRGIVAVVSAAPAI